MKNGLLLYLKFIQITLRKGMVHRAAYFAGIIGQWFGYGTTFATLYIVVTKFNVIADWNPYEVMFLYGLSVMAYAIGASFFYTPCTSLADKIRTGEFDQTLTRPIHPFIHEMYQGYNMGYFGHLVLSIVIMIISLHNIGFTLSFKNIIFILLMILGASLIQEAILILSSVGSFFMINDNPIIDFFLFGMKDFIDYPITIFPKFIQIILTFILPFAFINFYPAAALFDKQLPQGFPDFIQYLGPIIGVLLFISSIVLWNWGLSKYKSSGS